jgi:mRNA-degrading endonuclease RelE of RelBE toxin-antitoxin system
LTSNRKLGTLHCKQYIVKIPKNIEKITRDMPSNAVETLKKLIDDIRDNGPIQSAYHNYSRLGESTYHCHLAYRWVACWRCKNGEYIVEVEYVGSREKAPY